MSHSIHRFVPAVALTVAVLAFATGAAAQRESVRLAGTVCESPPAFKCLDGTCSGQTIPGGERPLVVADGPVIEAETGLPYFLDYPCDLQPGEEVTFVLSLHGAGAPGNWHRHYFPIVDYKDEYRLVIATPYSTDRRWSEEYDAYLQNVVNTVVAEIGADNIRAFWMAGHSQGGFTSGRLVCTPFFRDRVDGVLSLSGGRLGGAAPVRLVRPGADEGGGGGAGGRGAAPAPASVDCDFSHVYTTGEHEMVDGLASLPATSDLAERFGCSQRAPREDIIDTEGGYVGGGDGDEGTLSWGRAPGPGIAYSWVYPDCDDGRLVADVVRLDKGHTEGLEPNVTEALIRLMLSAEGGKLRN